MVAVDAPGTANDATYGYDHRGTRVSQTTGGQTRRFLYDKRNPTGYAKAIEERVEGTLDRSYVLGLRVEGQADSQGMVYFLLDGHGSNRALLDTNGSVQANYDYEAFGDAIGFTAASALMSSGFTQNMALGITGTFFGAAGAGMSAYGFHKAWQEGDRVGMAFAGAGFLLSASMFAMSGKTLYNGIVRTGYVREVQALRGLADSARAAGQGEEATARMLHQMRRGIGVKYKDMTPARELAQIKAGNLKEYGDELGPSVEFLRARGKSWAEIIESACRPGGHRYGWGLD